MAFILAFIVIRSLGEEEMLRRELDGYNEYMKKVKWRLILFVF
jgi:protein-S-isoprenylcysteine O-methyltransferase Ste14